MTKIKHVFLKNSKKNTNFAPVNSHVLNDGKGQDARTHRCGLDCISV